MDMSDFNETDYKYFKKEFADLKEHILKSTTDIQSQLKILSESFVKRDEFEKRMDRMDSFRDREVKELKDELAKKLDTEDFEPWKSTLSKLNWIVLSTVILAIMGLIIKAS